MSFARTRRHADYYTSTSLLTTIVAGLLECSMPRLHSDCRIMTAKS
jgi:hypothetical protein